MATLLWRWNLAFSLASNRVPSVATPLDKLLLAIGANTTDASGKLFRHFNGHDADARQLQALEPVNTPADLAGLILSSPAFQRC
jgi:hypothetical protein